jgi:hypothetical protein
MFLCDTFDLFFKLLIFFKYYIFQRIPSEIANGLLLHKDHILMQTPYTDRLIGCEIKTSDRSKDWTMKEKFFTDGWYEFVRRYRPNVGDTVRFQLSEPVEAVHVEIIRSG